jgi:hypothetical protein
MVIILSYSVVRLIKMATQSMAYILAVIPKKLNVNLVLVVYNVLSKSILTLVLPRIIKQKKQPLSPNVTLTLTLKLEHQ